MRQVMPHRSDIVSDPYDCKGPLHKKMTTYHSFGRTADRLFQLAGAQIMRLASFAFGHGGFKTDQATGKVEARLPDGGSTADNRRERQ
jgi:hypothetical protein